jgi:hypothetical protein
MAEEKQEGQKTVVSFIVGLLIGGLLVWAFSGPAVDAPEDKKEGDKKEKTEEKKDVNKEESASSEVKSEDSSKGNEEVKKEEVKATLPVGDGKVVVNTQSAGNSVKLDSATYPVKEGWIGVRDYQDGNMGGILGVARFSEEQGLVPKEIVLQRPTVAGKEYAVVVYEESGDRRFSVADDKQIDKVFTTFKVE